MASDILIACLTSICTMQSGAVDGGSLIAVFDKIIEFSTEVVGKRSGSQWFLLCVIFDGCLKI